MKQCIADGCSRNQFGGGYCSYHQYIRHKQGGDKFKRKAPVKKPLPKQSPKRKTENKRYLVRLQEKWEEAVNNKTNLCIFCGETMDKREDNHHLRNRYAYFLDEAYWSWAHRICHSNYTDYSYEQLIKEPWYDAFLLRIKEIDQNLYYKELNKRNKSQKDLFLSED